MSLQPIVAWTFSPDPDVAGYRIYYSTSPSFASFGIVEIPVPCQNFYRMTQLTWWVVNYVKMTAYDTSGNESGFSNVASVLVSGGLILK